MLTPRRLPPHPPRWLEFVARNNPLRLPCPLKPLLRLTFGPLSALPLLLSTPPSPRRRRRSRARNTNRRPLLFASLSSLHKPLRTTLCDEVTLFVCFCVYACVCVCCLCILDCLCSYVCVSVCMCLYTCMFYFFVLLCLFVYLCLLLRPPARVQGGGFFFMNACIHPRRTFMYTLVYFIERSSHGTCYEECQEGLL